MTKVVKVKSYDELKNESWFVDGMKRFCGKKTTILVEIDENFVILSGFGAWQFHKSGLIEM